jgi:hypothetical protein
MFSFQKGSWHDLNPGKIKGVKEEVVTEPDETDNHVDASTPVEDQLANDVRDQYE